MMAVYLHGQHGAASNTGDTMQTLAQAIAIATKSGTKLNIAMNTLCGKYNGRDGVSSDTRQSLGSVTRKIPSSSDRAYTLSDLVTACMAKDDNDCYCWRS